MEVESQVLIRLLEEAVKAHPEESCGMLLGERERITSILASTNVAPDPRTHFEIDPRALIAAHRAARGGGRQVLGYYHSHPAGDCSPSVVDRAMAESDGMVWAIVAAGRVAFWRAGPAGFEPLPYRTPDG